MVRKLQQKLPQKKEIFHDYFMQTCVKHARIRVFTAWNMREYRSSLTRVCPYKDRIVKLTSLRCLKYLLLEKTASALRYEASTLSIPACCIFRSLSSIRFASFAANWNVFDLATFCIYSDNESKGTPCWYILSKNICNHDFLIKVSFILLLRFMNAGTWCKLDKPDSKVYSNASWTRKWKWSSLTVEWPYNGEQGGVSWSLSILFLSGSLNKCSIEYSWDFFDNGVTGVRELFKLVEKTFESLTGVVNFGAFALVSFIKGLLSTEGNGANNGNGGKFKGDSGLGSIEYELLSM